MNISTVTPQFGFARWAVTVVFGLLSLAFLFRAGQFGYKWLSGVVEGDTNFKAMTIWALIYVVVCAGIAAVAYFMPREIEENEASEENHKAERGT